MSRSKSVGPDLVHLSNGISTLRRPPPPPSFERSLSAGPRSSRYLPVYDDDSALATEADRALINQHVNPYQEFPSLKRGFSKQPLQVDEPKVHGEGDVCAYYFWAITLCFFALAVLNFVVLVAILLGLGIGPDGLSSVEFLPDDGSIKFLKDIWVPDITLSGVISGFADEPLILKSENGDILFQVRDSSIIHSSKVPEMHISHSGISLNNVDSFIVLDPDTGKVIFDANSPVFSLDDNTIETLSVREIETNRVVSPVDKDLFIQSDAGLSLIGTEGISIESKSIIMEAAENITFESGAIHISGDVVIDPLALPLGGGGYPGEKPQYKICICYPSGKLFTVPAMNYTSRNSCDVHIGSGRVHPCDQEN